MCIRDSSKIDTTHVLKAFQLGADSVIVAGCAEDDESGKCPFQKTMFWAGQRVSRVKKILTDVGIDAERVALLNFTPQEVANFGEAIAETLAKMQELGPVSYTHLHSMKDDQECHPERSEGSKTLHYVQSDKSFFIL